MNSGSVEYRFREQEIKAININEKGIGEICIRGENLMMGYFNDPEETAKVIDEVFRLVPHCVIWAFM